MAGTNKPRSWKREEKGGVWRGLASEDLSWSWGSRGRGGPRLCPSSELPAFHQA